MAVEISYPAFTDDVHIAVGSFNSFTVYQMAAPGSGTPHVQLSPDGSAWFDAGAFNAAGYLALSDAAAFVRVHGGSGTAGVYALRGVYSHEGG